MISESLEGVSRSSLKMSMEECPELELKMLPEHLEYVFLWKEVYTSDRNLIQAK